MNASTQAKFTNPAQAGEAALAAELAEIGKQVVTTIKGQPRTHDDLSAAFRRVQDKQHWKNPIDATVGLTDFERVEMCEAITFFTGSVATFKLLADGQFRVTAPGYFMTCGA